MRKVFQSAARQPAPSSQSAETGPPQSLLSRSHLSRPTPEAAAEIARYISQLTAEMAGMAGAARLEMLAYFLDMARNEAEMAARMPLAPLETDPRQAAKPPPGTARF